jgi:hypothetical protein
MMTSWSTPAGLVLLGLLAVAPGVARADILPVATPTAPLGPFPYTLKSSSPVTLAILDPSGADTTDTWLPEPGQAVRLVVRVNGVMQIPAPAMSLVAPAAPVVFSGLTNPFLNPTALTTSAYPGQCGNTDNPAPMAQNAPDYTLSGDILTATDCGGFAVVDVLVPGQGGTFRFIVPQDGSPGYAPLDGHNSNGIPASFEDKFCNTVPCPTGAEDADLRPTVSNLLGDSAGALDEYRGYMVAGVHRRTDPRQVDLFVFLVNPQCHGDPSGVPPAAARALSRLGGGTLTYPTPGNGTLFDGAVALYGAGVTHLMHTPGATNHRSTEFVDRFKRYEVSLGQRFLDANGVETGTAPADDRRINKNAVLSGNQPQKVIRVIECIAPPPPTSPLALAGTVSVTAAGYAILYTERIISHLNSLVTAGAGRSLRFATYQGGRATTPQLLGVPTVTSVNFLISQAIKFYTAHEVFHVGNLVPPAGAHDPVGTGNFLDSAIMTKVDNKTSGFNTFYVPTLPDSVSSLYRSNYLVE